MNATTTALIISDIQVRQDVEGRYSLNDLHKAAGGDAKHQPALFMRLDSTQALADEITRSTEMQIAPITSKKGGKDQGTFVVIELVYAYGMWISPAFHLKVIRAYHAAMTRSAPRNALKDLGTHKALPGCLTIEQQDAVKALVKSRVDVLPKEKQAKGAITCWSSIKSKFGMGYKEVPAEHFTEVLSLVARLPLEGEHIPAESPRLFKRYDYPRKLLEQSFFKTDKIPASLGIAMLGDTAQFVSPLFAMLNEMRVDGHDIGAPWDEAVAMREAIQRADKAMNDIGILMFTSRFEFASTSGNV